MFPAPPLAARHAAAHAFVLFSGTLNSPHFYRDVQGVPAALTWENADFRWRKLTIADKVETSRTIPLSPYVAQMLATLPRVGPHVFANTGKAGRITDARASHSKALKSASIEGLTIHGLRRSFSLLGEAAGAPAGAIAQVMGHKPSATSIQDALDRRIGYPLDDGALGFIRARRRWVREALEEAYALGAARRARVSGTPCRW